MRVSAEVTFPLKLQETVDAVDDWFPLVAAAPNMKGEMGSIRLKAQYIHEVVMPLEEYTSLKEVQILVTSFSISILIRLHS